MRCEYIGIYWGILHPWNILPYCALLRNIRRYWRNIFQPNTGIYWSISRRRQAPQSFRNILQYTAVYPNIFTACLPHYWLIVRNTGKYCCKTCRQGCQVRANGAVHVVLLPARQSRASVFSSRLLRAVVEADCLNCQPRG